MSPIRTSLRRHRRRQGGWIMLMVLLVLLVLGVAVTAFYTQTEDHLFTGQSMAAHAIAASRAELGAQRAIAELRAGVLPLLNVVSPCNDQPPNNPFVACSGLGLGIPLAGGPLDNGPAMDLKAGGGLQYNYVIYRPALFGANQNLFSVRSIGYYGYALGSPNLYTSEVEVTVEVGSATPPPCANAQDYGGCGGG